MAETQTDDKNGENPYEVGESVLQAAEEAAPSPEQQARMNRGSLLACGSLLVSVFAAEAVSRIDQLQVRGSSMGESFAAVAVPLAALGVTMAICFAGAKRHMRSFVRRQQAEMSAEP